MRADHALELEERLLVEGHGVDVVEGDAAVLEAGVERLDGKVGGRLAAVEPLLVGCGHHLAVRTRVAEASW